MPPWTTPLVPHTTTLVRSLGREVLRVSGSTGGGGDRMTAADVKRRTRPQQQRAWALGCPADFFAAYAAAAAVVLGGAVTMDVTLTDVCSVWISTAAPTTTPTMTCLTCLPAGGARTYNVFAVVDEVARLADGDVTMTSDGMAQWRGAVEAGSTRPSLCSAGTPS